MTLEGVETMISAVIWTLDRKKYVFLGLSITAFAGYAVASTYGGYSNYNVYNGLSLINFDDPYQVLSGFVAPFLLITLIFERGYNHALSFTLGDEPNNRWPAPNEDKERVRIKKYSMIMALATAGMIVPTPWFQLIRQWVAFVFGSLGFLFFTAIFVAFIYILYKAFS